MESTFAARPLLAVISGRGRGGWAGAADRAGRTGPVADRPGWRGAGRTGPPGVGLVTELGGADRARGRPVGQSLPEVDSWDDFAG
jgi:hypothetical protein